MRGGMADIAARASYNSASAIIIRYLYACRMTDFVWDFNFSDSHIAFYNNYGFNGESEACPIRVFYKGQRPLNSISIHSLIHARKPGDT